MRIFSFINTFAHNIFKRDHVLEPTEEDLIAGKKIIYIHLKFDLNLREVLKLVKGKRSGSPTYILFSLLYPPPGHVKCKKYNFNGI